MQTDQGEIEHLLVKGTHAASNLPHNAHYVKPTEVIVQLPRRDFRLTK